ncbi:threonylcarbamoyl-AMP synthase [Arthrobacter livingstonensis]|uniref:Threonylcarbamoyl-AMP synthase n=1 Tax=Arthrobacter livingstonensis TaxID=670078 RepID=A0A2V5LAP7_9MICC|nr:L-threonylcarbamoyladenylate synthase [Arthrobacter livingstonensis]PYI68685.1 threonylcarbamoyl-AMP synthase [Arthrobacter livingstonensis]
MSNVSTTSYNCTNDEQRALGLAHAQKAIAAKQVIVMPTDTVYGIAADAFSPQAVATLLAAKGRGRNMPPPVLIPRIGTMEGLATDIPDDARKLAEKYWPGPLTLIFHAQPSLTWDLGDAVGTVALRVPDEQLALDLLTLTGPLAVSSANRTGQPAAQTAQEAREQLAESVEVYLEAGFRPLEGTVGVPSTIVDATGLRLRVVREGAISLADIQRMVPSALGSEPEPEMWSPSGEESQPGAGDATISLQKSVPVVEPAPEVEPVGVETETGVEPAPEVEPVGVETETGVEPAPEVEVEAEIKSEPAPDTK